MGAKEFTGGDIQAFLKLAGPDPAADPQIAVQRTDYEAKRQRRKTARKLEESALEGGYLDNFLSMLASDELEISKEQAYYAAWVNAHPQVRQPKTKLGVANFLGVSRTVLYKWQDADWFKKLALGRWRFDLFLDHLATVDRKMVTEAEELTGAPGVAARNQFYQQALRILGLESGEDGLPGSMSPQVNIYLPDNGR